MPHTSRNRQFISSVINIYSYMYICLSLTLNCKQFNCICWFYFAPIGEWVIQKIISHSTDKHFIHIIAKSVRKNHSLATQLNVREIAQKFITLSIKEKYSLPVQLYQQDFGYWMFLVSIPRDTSLYKKNKPTRIVIWNGISLFKRKRNTSFMYKPKLFSRYNYV